MKRIWDMLVEEVAVNGGWDGFEKEIQSIMAEMDVREIMEMSMGELLEKVEKEMQKKVGKLTFSLYLQGVKKITIMDQVLKDVASIMLHNDKVTSISINEDTLHVQPCTREMLTDLRKAILSAGSDLEKYWVVRNRDIPNWFKTWEVRKRTEEEIAKLRELLQETL